MSTDKMSIYEEMNASSQKAQAIVDQAKTRMTSLAENLHKESKERVEEYKKSNVKSLQELKVRLDKENDEKIKQLEIDTNKTIDLYKQNGEKHLSQITDLLYKLVITVE